MSRVYPISSRCAYGKAGVRSLRGEVRGIHNAHLLRAAMPAQSRPRSRKPTYLDHFDRESLVEIREEFPAAEAIEFLGEDYRKVWVLLSFGGPLFRSSRCGTRCANMGCSLSCGLASSRELGTTTAPLLRRA